MIDDAKEIDPDELFGSIDFTADVVQSAPEKAADEEPNAFQGFEENLKLPIGSTKEALNAAKKQAKELIAKTKDIKNSVAAVDAKEKLNYQLGLGITADVLRSDRERIRQEAFETYQIGKEMLDAIRDQLLNTITPSDKMWSAAASVFTSVSGAVERLLKMTTTLRQEMEIDDEKILQSSADPNAAGAQEMNFSPDQINALIEQWSNEQEDEVNREIQEQMRVKQIEDKR